LLKREARIIRRVEGAACLNAHTVLAVSERDREALWMAASQNATIEVVPIGVDVERFLPVAATRCPQPFRLLSIGTMYWPPNSDGVMWWLRDGYERLRATCPDVQYDIVGARPPRRLRRLAREHSGVTLHGYVADTSHFWVSAGALAVPLLAGGGTRVKILEAMAMGVPVVSTSLGAEGLAVRHGEHVLLADTPVEFAEACAAVLRDRALAQRLTERAYQLVLERYDAPIALRALDRVYSGVIEGKISPCALRL
jgi:glycosyltransferase involved in cell wall biosynthesis